jgi:hypothetical protein
LLARPTSPAVTAMDGWPVMIRGSAIGVKPLAAPRRTDLPPPRSHRRSVPRKVRSWVLQLPGDHGPDEAAPFVMSWRCSSPDGQRRNTKRKVLAAPFRTRRRAAVSRWRPV